MDDSLLVESDPDSWLERPRPLRRRRFFLMGSPLSSSSCLGCGFGSSEGLGSGLDSDFGLFSEVVSEVVSELFSEFFSEADSVVDSVSPRPRPRRRRRFFFLMGSPLSSTRGVESSMGRSAFSACSAFLAKSSASLRTVDSSLSSARSIAQLESSVSMVDHSTTVGFGLVILASLSVSRSLPFFS